MMPSRQTLSMSLAAAVLTLGMSGPTFGADLHFPETSADVGEMRSGPVLRRSFRFVNRGTGPVEITGARASCGCMTPRLSQRVLQPGDEGTMILEVNTASQAPGPHTWRAHVSFRHGDTSAEVALQLTVRLIAEVTIEPGAMT